MLSLWRAATAYKSGLPRRLHSFVLPASRFQYLLSRGRACPLEYEGVPLANLNSKQRGELLSTIVRGIRLNGESAKTEDAEPGMRSDGRRRSSNNAEYDWLCNGCRVECKSSMFQWSSHGRRWSFKFQDIKFDLFDSLFLVLYTPEELIVYQHDRYLGISSAGMRTQPDGYHIMLYGPKNEHNWKNALLSVLCKLDATTNDSSRIARLSLNHSSVTDVLRTFQSSLHATLMDGAYHQVPLANTSGAARGVKIQNIVRIVDTILNLGSHMAEPALSVRLNGARRSPAQAEYDWKRDGQRIECKSAQLTWDSYHRRWRCCFRAVKHASFDELFLCLYTPRGLCVYQHDGMYGVSSNGVRSATTGYDIVATGPRGEQDWSIALDSILRKLERSSCKHVVFIEW